MKNLILISIISMFLSCDACREKSDCSELVYVQNNASEPKVVRLSLFFPDTTYQCQFMLEDLKPNGKVSFYLGGRGECWDGPLQDVPLQVFVLDSTIFADSTCEAIRANPQLYQRMEFTLDELKSQNWVVSVD